MLVAFSLNAYVFGLL